MAILVIVAACGAGGGGEVCAPAASWVGPASRCRVPAPPPVDELLAELEHDPEPVRAAAAPVAIEHARIELREQVQFETGSAVLLDRSRALLDEVAALIRAHPEIALVEIRGHTDGDGTAAFNQRLSEERAAAVRAHLVAAGVAPGRLRARGVGEREHVADDATPAGKAANRRVELRIVERR